MRACAFALTPARIVSARREYLLKSEAGGVLPLYCSTVPATASSKYSRISSGTEGISSFSSRGRLSGSISHLSRTESRTESCSGLSGAFSPSRAVVEIPAPALRCAAGNSCRPSGKAAPPVCTQADAVPACRTRTAPAIPSAAARQTCFRSFMQAGSFFDSWFLLYRKRNSHSNPT